MYMFAADNIMGSLAIRHADSVNMFLHINTGPVAHCHSIFVSHTGLVCLAKHGFLINYNPCDVCGTALLANLQSDAVRGVGTELM